MDRNQFDALTKVRNYLVIQDKNFIGIDADTLTVTAKTSGVLGRWQASHFIDDNGPKAAANRGTIDALFKIMGSIGVSAGQLPVALRNELALARQEGKPISGRTAAAVLTAAMAIPGEKLFKIDMAKVNLENMERDGRVSAEVDKVFKYLGLNKSNFPDIDRRVVDGIRKKFEESNMAQTADPKDIWKATVETFAEKFFLEQGNPTLTEMRKDLTFSRRGFTTDLSYWLTTQLTEQNQGGTPQSINSFYRMHIDHIDAKNELDKLLSDDANPPLGHTLLNESLSRDFPGFTLSLNSFIDLTRAEYVRLKPLVSGNNDEMTNPELVNLRIKETLDTLTKKLLEEAFPVMANNQIAHEAKQGYLELLAKGQPPIDPMHLPTFERILEDSATFADILVHDRPDKIASELEQLTTKLTEKLAALQQDGMTSNDAVDLVKMGVRVAIENKTAMDLLYKSLVPNSDFLTALQSIVEKTNPVSNALSLMVDALRVGVEYFQSSGLIHGTLLNIPIPPGAFIGTPLSLSRPGTHEEPLAMEKEEIGRIEQKMKEEIRHFLDNPKEDLGTDVNDEKWKLSERFFTDVNRIMVTVNNQRVSKDTFSTFFPNKRAAALNSRLLHQHMHHALTDCTEKIRTLWNSVVYSPALAQNNYKYTAVNSDVLNEHTYRITISFSEHAIDLNHQTEMTNLGSNKITDYADTISFVLSTREPMEISDLTTDFKVLVQD